VSGTLLAAPTAPDPAKKFGLSYQLACTGPRQDVGLAEKEVKVRPGDDDIYPYEP
jgi:hypothetical protein